MYLGSIFVFFSLLFFFIRNPFFSMERLPDEIILRIASFIATTEWQLLELEKVSTKLRCLIQDQTLWYQLFQQNFKNWGYHIPYAFRRQLIDWRAFVIHLAKQKRRSRSLTFDFVPDEPSLDPVINRKRKIHELARSSSSPSPSSPSYKNLTRPQEPNFVDNHQHYIRDSTALSSTDDSLYTMPDMTSASIDLSPHGPSSSIPLAEPSFDRSSLRHIFTRRLLYPSVFKTPCCGHQSCHSNWCGGYWKASKSCCTRRLSLKAIRT
ncbi:hypothetical protein BCR42DRAFT_144489 [Absidia repens]|uniref:F-box domain-containing protein n=1 Tax=Absidia repens TaxID=90262 RepID=A0A1X2I388_9FUNG|nr:hypothetical protein BCR42DRAFT_144489 [Absidia repens]